MTTVFTRVADGETEQHDLKIRNTNDVSLTEVSLRYEISAVK